MCKLIRSLYNLIPILSFRAFFIRKHISLCPKCQKEWTLDKSTEEFFTVPEWIKKEQSLWPRIQETIRAAESGDALDERRKTTLFFPRWQWALAGLALLILVGINLVLNKGLLQSLSGTEVSLALKTPQVKIIHAEIHGKKAKPYVFQTPENLFIWFEEIKLEEN
jgi:hypothetical protein